MHKIVWLSILLAASLLAYSGPETPAVEQAADASWTAEFPVEKGELSASGRNPYFILEPGYQLVLEEGKERLTVTVLDETRTVEGLETRVVEERETKAANWSRFPGTTSPSASGATAPSILGKR